LEEPGAPLLITVNKHLCMASSAENVASFFELMTELGMVEDLAGGGEDDLTIFVR